MIKRECKYKRKVDFETAVTRGGFPKEIYEVVRLKNRMVWNIIGTVFVNGRKIFVIWESSGAAYVCHERATEFDLLLKL